MKFPLHAQRLSPNETLAFGRGLAAKGLSHLLLYTGKSRWGILVTLPKRWSKNNPPPDGQALFGPNPTGDPLRDAFQDFVYQVDRATTSFLPEYPNAALYHFREAIDHAREALNGKDE